MLTITLTCLTKISSANILSVKFLHVVFCEHKLLHMWGSSLERCGDTISPAVLKILSEETLVGGQVRYLIAT